MTPDVHDSYDAIAARSIDTSTTDFLLPEPEAIEGLCKMAEKTLGLTWAGEAAGAYLVIPGKDREQFRLERHRAFCAVPLHTGDVAKAAVACMQRIADRFGRGTYWTTGGRPHFVVGDDGRPRVFFLRTDGDVEPHVVLVVYYFHDGGLSLLSRERSLADLGLDELQAGFEHAERDAVAGAEQAEAYRAEIARRASR